MRNKKFYLLIITTLLCGVYLYFRTFGSGISVNEFHPFSNFTKNNQSINIDLSDAVYRGIEIPTSKQLPGGKFAFTVKLKTLLQLRRSCIIKYIIKTNLISFQSLKKAENLIMSTR